MALDAPPRHESENCALSNRKHANRCKCDTARRKPLHINMAAHLSEITSVPNSHFHTILPAVHGNCLTANPRDVGSLLVPAIQVWPQTPEGVCAFCNPFVPECFDASRSSRHSQRLCNRVHLAKSSGVSLAITVLVLWMSVRIRFARAASHPANRVWASTSMLCFGLEAHTIATVVPRFGAVFYVGPRKWHIFRTVLNVWSRHRPRRPAIGWSHVRTPFGPTGLLLQGRFWSR